LDLRPQSTKRGTVDGCVAHVFIFGVKPLMQAIAA
jgi:hypothetical protein